MLNWIRKLLGLCQHKWVVRDEYALNNSDTGRQYGVKYVLQCEKCGALKNHSA